MSGGMQVFTFAYQAKRQTRPAVCSRPIDQYINLKFLRSALPLTAAWHTNNRTGKNITIILPVFELACTGQHYGNTATGHADSDFP